MTNNLTRQQKIDLLKAIESGMVSIEEIKDPVIELWEDLEGRPDCIVNQMTGQIIQKREMRERVERFEAADKTNQAKWPIAILWCDLDSDT